MFLSTIYCRAHHTLACPVRIDGNKCDWQHGRYWADIKKKKKRSYINTLPLLTCCECTDTRMSFSLAGEDACTCESVDSQAASFRVVDAHGVWRDVCSIEGDPLIDDRARDRRLRARRRGVWSEDMHATRRLSKVQKDVMFRPSAACLRREAFGDAGEENGGNLEKGRMIAGQQNTKLGAKADLRSPAGKAGGFLERVQRGRRMSMGSIKDWGEKEETFDLVRKGWKEAESSPNRVDNAPTNPVQNATEGRRGIFRSVFTKWRGVRCFEPTMVDR